MGFLAPVSFWFLSAIPILLIFYFFKKQFEQQTISSIYLWEQALQEWESDRWWNKLQKNLLLLLQLLILLFLIFALTRPYFTGDRVSGDHLVIVMDSSATMMAERDGTSRFANAKEQAEDLIKKLGNEHKVSVIHAQKDPVLLASNETNHEVVLDEIRKLQVSYQHENMKDSLQLAYSLIQQETGEVHVFTDNLDKETLTEQTFSNPIVVHNGKAAENNIAIKAFGVKQTGDQISAIVTAENESAEAMDVTFTVSNDGNELEQVTESIPPNEQLTFNLENLSVHQYYQVKIEEDAYLSDNTMYALLPEQQAPSIYLAGEVNPFIEQALLSAGHDVTTVPTDENGAYSFPEATPETIYILSGVDAEQWPAGPKLVLSPSVGGPFDVKEKTALTYGLKQVNDDPMLSYADVGNVYLEKAFPVNNWNGFNPLVQSGEQTVIGKGIYEEAPLILFAFDLDDSDWPLQPGFPILLANSVAELAGSGESLGYFSPMESATVNFSTTANEVVLEQLDGENVQEMDLGNPEVIMPRTPGIYQLHEKTAAGSLYRYFVVQLDNEERTGKAAESFSIDGEGAKNTDVQLTKQEIWRIFAAIALLILFIEWEVYRRGISSR
ncbi:von Willebrand factor type A domain-containing protein [Gracilibacillus ureilyticus]|uniref:von Willebrand factor type A domain-containing protein n=1 Tax=Gracilibacillus ureilyticus TaxID=531814 RepID=A0A1H9TXL2_9BACI|nr:BatA and WFA domain-containing protein [Gracilibacillus ureilyticus]SES01738.1 von Willebrand factor type A domain-containing protein [Gracilibacillus ureilyticus]